jgi:hypothetical protein
MLHVSELDDEAIGSLVFVSRHAENVHQDKDDNVSVWMALVDPANHWVPGCPPNQIKHRRCYHDECTCVQTADPGVGNPG